MKALAAATLIGAVIMAGLIILPLTIAVAAGPNATPNNQCFAAGSTPPADITLIGRCLEEVTR